VIGLYLQVLAVIAIVAVAATALGNELRLLIDERHEERAYAHVGRHRRSSYSWIDDASAAFVRRYDTAQLFARADEAFNASAPTEYVTRVTA
jgi:uncharacterized protein YktB (UPF0637 family)